MGCIIPQIVRKSKLLSVCLRYFAFAETKKKCSGKGVSGVNAACAVLAFVCTHGASDEQGEWTPLFNGEDLGNWTKSGTPTQPAEKKALTPGHYWIC